MSQPRFQTDYTQANRPDNNPETVFPDPRVKSDRFRFGLEVEYIVTRLSDFHPLWHEDLNFSELNALLEKIDFSDVPGDYSSLEIEPPHRKAMPYIVEGYHLPNANFEFTDMKPKGVEIRTPVCDSLDECIETYKTLYARLRTVMEESGYAPVGLSHHPLATQFRGPMNKRRYDFWLWAMEVMTTYGPDINVSVPSELLENFELQDFERKINYYAPALTLASVASPFFAGKAWKGPSYRTFKRSVTAPAIEYHSKEGNRFEFKPFEMSPNPEDFRAYFLLFMTVLLDENLKGRSTKSDRIYDLGDVARYGHDAEEVRARLGDVLAASHTLNNFGFDPAGLLTVMERFESRETLSDQYLEVYRQNSSINDVMEFIYKESNKSLTC